MNIHRTRSLPIILEILLLLGLTNACEFVPDSEWRDKITDADTEKCINEVISLKFNINNINFYKVDENIALVKEYKQHALKEITRVKEITKKNEGSNIANDKALKTTLSFIKRALKLEEQTLYESSKGKYKCDHKKVFNHKVKFHEESTDFASAYFTFLLTYDPTLPEFNRVVYHVENEFIQLMLYNTLLQSIYDKSFEINAKRFLKASEDLKK